MKEDIPFLPVEDIKIAIAKKTLEDGSDEWAVYLINYGPKAIKNAMIVSKGYGKDNDGNEQNTSTLRHMFEMVPSNQYVQVERIDKSVFHLFNQYWLSYYLDKQILDKKFIFVPGSITEENLTDIPTLNLKGILHF